MMMSFMGAGYHSQNDVTWGQANNTGVPPNQKSKQSRITNLSLYKHWVLLNQVYFESVSKIRCSKTIKFVHFLHFNSLSQEKNDFTKNIF
jgi:hypothetical protein